MGRELRRLLIAPERIAALDNSTDDEAGPDGGTSQLALEPQEHHYLERVLRYRPGDRLAVVDGAGRLWSAVLETRQCLRLEQPISAPLQWQAPARPALLLAMAVPKREADLVWRMATELGADRLQPLLARRGAPGERCPLERWQGIVREATEQCERLWQPLLEAPQLAGAWLARPVNGLALLATTRHRELPLCSQLLEEPCAAPDLGDGIQLAIGPEGGWSPEEEEQAIAAGWRPVSLGPSILRTSTAAVSGLSQLAEWRALRSASCRRPSP
jgi:16S rRNA (uracil1498-N3)-methyltransferase